jgi:hypothetical protein
MILEIAIWSCFSNVEYLSMYYMMLSGKVPEQLAGHMGEGQKQCIYNYSEFGGGVKGDGCLIYPAI